MDDREVVAAIAAGDPAGIATAYDTYAAALYGYCHWMLRQPAAAAEALRDTFAAATALGGLPEAPKLRPWLYAVARNECQRRLLAASPAYGEEAGGTGRRAGGADRPADDADQPADATVQFRAIHPPADTTRQPADATVQFRAIHPPADTTDRLTGVHGHTEQAELRTLTRAILAELEPDQREAIELSLRHNLHDSDLATALGVPWSEAHALISGARRRLEKDLGALLIARTGREDCLVLDAQLADWDGQLTEQVRDLVGEHIEQCGICAGSRRSALRPAIRSGLPPLAVLPPGLRDDVLRLCSPATPDTPVHGRDADPVRPSGVSAVIRAMRWDNIKSHPGAAIATAGIALWVVAAVSVTLLVLGSHSARALPARPGTSAPASGPTASRATTGPTTSRTPASARPSPAVSQRSAYLTPSAGPSATAGTVGPTQAAVPPGPSTSPSPKPSKSPSPSPSRSSSPSPSPSKSPSSVSSTSPPPSP